MIFKDFKDIIVDNEFGVSPVGKDTLLMASNAIKIKFKCALDIGTGTGFIPIYLTKCGYNCAGCDISPFVINCAKRNAKKNNIKINFFVSNLFENVHNKFDLITFNPPFGNTSSHSVSKYLEIIKSFFPKESKLVAKTSFPLIKKQRENLIKRFFVDYTNFLTDNGNIIIFLHHSELSLVDKFSYKIIDGYDDMKLVLIESNRF